MVDHIITYHKAKYILVLVYIISITPYLNKNHKKFHNRNIGIFSGDGTRMDGYLRVFTETCACKIKPRYNLI